MGEIEENWIKEEEEEKIIDENTIEAVSNKNMQYEGYIFENKLGTNITFYVNTMSGERSPDESYKKYTLEPDTLTFIDRNELKRIRKEQSKAKYGQALKLISEDMIRIMVMIEGYNFTSDVPIELGGSHSFTFVRGIPKSKNKYKELSLPVVCRVSNSVNLIHIKLEIT